MKPRELDSADRLIIKVKLTAWGVTASTVAALSLFGITSPIYGHLCTLVFLVYCLVALRDIARDDRRKRAQEAASRLGANEHAEAMEQTSTPWQ